LRRGGSFFFILPKSAVLNVSWYVLFIAFAGTLPSPRLTGALGTSQFIFGGIIRNMTFRAWTSGAFLQFYWAA
jgi:hypothetical protein